jgi:hypothetical protein
MRYYSSSDTMEVTKTKTIFQSAILKLGSFFKEEKGHFQISHFSAISWWEQVIFQ